MNLFNLWPILNICRILFHSTFFFLRNTYFLNNLKESYLRFGGFGYDRCVFRIVDQVKDIFVVRYLIKLLIFSGWLKRWDDRLGLDLFSFYCFHELIL